MINVTANPGRTGTRDVGRRCVVEQVNRPTGLLDSGLEKRPGKGARSTICPHEIRQPPLNGGANETSVTNAHGNKRMSEDLTDNLAADGRGGVRYMHADIDCDPRRMEIVRGLRLSRVTSPRGHQPASRRAWTSRSVSQVAIIDADQEGFLRRATRSQIQTRWGRAGPAHESAWPSTTTDRITGSMQAPRSTRTDRTPQTCSATTNTANNITPHGVVLGVWTKCGFNTAAVADARHRRRTRRAPAPRKIGGETCGAFTQ
jgi:excinuclease UvrABC helicase subunit UvrB